MLVLSLQKKQKRLYSSCLVSHEIVCYKIFNILFSILKHIDNDLLGIIYFLATNTKTDILFECLKNK